MALSKVQNFASLLGNNGLNGGKIDNGYNMFEAPPSNCATDNRCGEYDPWRYDLLGRNSNNKTTLEDDDPQDLNNTMVNDLVAKILDDDPIITEDAYASRYNGNPRYGNDSQPSRMLKGRNSTNPYYDDSIEAQSYYPYEKLAAQTSNIDDNQRDFVNMCGGLGTMSLNDCILQNLEKSNDYTNGMTVNNHRSAFIDPTRQQSHQQRIRSPNDGSNASRNYVSMSNGINYAVNQQPQQPQQSSNWSEPSNLTHEYTKDIFGNYQHIQNCTNPDMNFNTIALAEMDLHANLPNNPPLNIYGNQMLNIHDSYNPPNSTTNNQSQNYRSNSSISDINADNVYPNNSSLQQFSSSENLLQNFIGNNYSRNGYDDYKDFHDNAGMNISNSSINGESVYLQQHHQHHHHQQQSYKLDRQIDQNYKTLMNRYLTLNDFNLPSNDLCPAETNSMTPNHNHKIDGNILKVLNAKSKNRDPHNQSSILRATGYSRIPSQHSQIEKSTTKYNYQSNNGYQRYTASNSESLKAVPSTTNYPNVLKRSTAIGQTSSVNNGCHYKIDPYELANEIGFPAGAHIAQQIARASMDNNVFNQIMKQRHQQMQRMSGVPTAGVLFNARLMRGAGAGAVAGNAGNNVFPSVMPVVQVPVPQLNPMSVLFGGLTLRNGARSVRRPGPPSVLHMRLEQTFEQFNQLEKERKKCEASLADHFPGKRVSSANNIPTPRLLGNSSSRADRLIVDHFQEHARVITLIAKMEHLRGASMSERVHKAMEYWLETIKYVQECRKKEIEYVNMRLKENPECIPINDDKHVMALAESIHQLTKASRMARTGMYNALQATLLHDKDLEKKIVDTSTDAIVSSSPTNPVDRQSMIGEIGKFANTT